MCKRLGTSRKIREALGEMVGRSGSRDINSQQRDESKDVPEFGMQWWLRVGGEHIGQGKLHELQVEETTIGHDEEQFVSRKLHRPLLTRRKHVSALITRLAPRTTRPRRRGAGFRRASGLPNTM